MAEHKPFIDFENLPAPTEGFLVTQFITVRSVARSRAFYSDVLGGLVSAVLRRKKILGLTGMLLAPPLRRTALDRIELVGLGEDRALAVVVTDTGWVTARAITPLPRPNIEELRELGRTLTRRYRGKTRGLVKARALVEQFDGLYGVESELGRGASFWFTVTLRAVDRFGLSSRTVSRSFFMPAV